MNTRILTPLILAAATALPLAGTVAMPRPAVAADATPAPADGRVELNADAVAAGVGFEWGSGHLEYAGAKHRFKMTGLSVVDVGAAKISANGTVHHLKRLQDFNGTYTSFIAGATVAGGGGVAYLKNQNGVVIKLNSTSQGLRLKFSADGVKLKLES